MQKVLGRLWKILSQKNGFVGLKNNDTLPILMHVTYFF